MHEQRPWGAFYVLEDADTHKVKRLHVHPGARLSYQRHQHRTEHWVIVSGEAEVTLDDEVGKYRAGETVYIGSRMKHRLANAGSEPLVVIEVQRGTYFGEDDIERFSDDYNRT